MAQFTSPEKMKTSWKVSEKKIVKKNSIEMNKHVKELSEMGTEFALGLGMSS